MKHEPSRVGLVRSELQRLTQVKVTGQKLRHRNWRTFPATTAQLISEASERVQRRGA